MDEICLDWHTIFSAHFLTEENGRTNVTWHIQVTSLKRFNKIRVGSDFPVVIYGETSNR
jgi:hypothetical protein